MHLDGEVLLGVDVLDQHGELVSGVLVHVLSDELSFEFLDQLGDGFTCLRAFDDHTFVVSYARKLPALGAPYQGLDNGFEFERIHSF